MVWKAISTVFLVCAALVSNAAILGLTIVGLKRLVEILGDMAAENCGDDKVVVSETWVSRERNGWIQKRVVYLQPGEGFDFTGWTIDKRTVMRVSKEELKEKKEYAKWINDCVNEAAMMRKEMEEKEIEKKKKKKKEKEKEEKEEEKKSGCIRQYQIEKTCDEWRTDLSESEW